MKASDATAAGHVVLGFDGGWRMPHLLRVAADEAVRRQACLAIVTVSRPALDPALGARGRQTVEHRALALAHRQLVGAAETVRARHPHLPVTTHALTEDDARDGVHPLSSTQLLVVGTIGKHSMRAFSLESVSRILLRAAHCPALVVPQEVTLRPGDREHRTVTAGVDEHDSNAGVVRAAWAESTRRGCDLKLIHAYAVGPGEDPGLGLRRAASVVARAIASAGVATGKGRTVLLRDDDPAAALARHAGPADLLVIGSRPGSLSGLVRGSVSLEILGSLSRLLLVVPDPRPDPWHQGPPVPEDARLDGGAPDGR